MATNPARIVVPGQVRVYLGAVGTTAPTTPVGTPGGGWVDVGLTTEDNMQLSESPEFQEVYSAQSIFPVRTYQTKDDISIAVTLLEWSAANFQAVYGGGAITTVSSGIYKFTPPAVGGRGEKAALIQVIDGTKHYIYVLPRVMQKEGVQQDLNRGGPAQLPLKLSVQGGDAADPWYLITDDPAFAGAS